MTNRFTFEDTVIRTEVVDLVNGLGCHITVGLRFEGYHFSYEVPAESVISHANQKVKVTVEWEDE